MPRPGIPPSQRHDQPQVGVEQVVLGSPALFGDPLKVHAQTRVQHPAACGELVVGEQARLDPLGQLDLLPGVEQRHLADLPEVVLDRVGRRAAGCHPVGGTALVIAGHERTGSSRDAAFGM
jgi:hypothetical protein